MSIPVRTVALPGPPSLVDLLPSTRALLWTRGGEGLAGWGEAARVPVPAGLGRFDAAVVRLAELFDTFLVEDEVGVPGTGPVAFGAFPFDPRTGGTELVVPEVVVGSRAGRGWLTTVGRGRTTFPPAREPLAGADRVRYAGSSQPDLYWLDAVATALDELAEGRYEKVVLARDHAVWARAPFDARRLVARLARRFPECFTFSVAGLVGATPELLVRRFGDAVESLVLAGSAERSADAGADARLGEALLESKKDRTEHEHAVTSVQSVLDAVCRVVAADPFPDLLRLANVQHLATRLRGELGSIRPTAMAIAGRLHPTAAVCGTPTADAMDAIRRLEGMERGRYSAPVGWVDGRGDGEWGIALRCAELSGARARLFAGAGIVPGSLPEAELEETRLKLQAMQMAFGD